MDKRHVFLFIVILLIAGSLRFYQATEPFNGHYAWKEVQHASMSQSMLKSGDPLDTSTHWLCRSNNVLLPSWFIIGSWSLFGTGELATRLPFILMGIGTAVLIFFIAQLLFDKRAAFLAFFFASISAYLAYFGRASQGESPMMFFTVLSVYLYLKFRQDGSYWYLVTSALSLTLAGLNKMPAIFVFGVYCIDQVIYHRKIFNKKVVSTVIASFAFSLPVIAFAIIASMNAVCDIWGIDAFFNFSIMLKPFFYFLKGFEIFAWTSVVFIPILLVHAYRLVKYKLYNHTNYQFIYLWLFMSLLMLVVISGMSYGNAYYVLVAYPPIIILAAAEMSNIADNWKKTYALLLISIALLGLISCFYIFYITYPYKEAGLYVQGMGVDHFYRAGSPAPCYYADIPCTKIVFHQVYEIEPGEVFSLGSLNHRLMTDEQRAYLDSEFTLIHTIVGQNNLVGGDFKLKKENDYELILIKK
ncbi:ArnT family glycosyltransferase [Nanoarchaeota archaeon]